MSAKVAKYVPPPAQRKLAEVKTASRTTASARSTVEKSTTKPLVLVPVPLGTKTPAVMPNVTETEVKVEEVIPQAVLTATEMVEMALALPDVPDDGSSQKGDDHPRTSRVCPYHLRGNCKRGRQCRLSHAAAGAPPGIVDRTHNDGNKFVIPQPFEGMKPLHVDFLPTPNTVKLAAQRYQVQLIPDNNYPTTHPLARIERRLARDWLVSHIIDEYPETKTILDFRGDARWWAAKSHQNPNWPAWYVNFPAIRPDDSIEIAKLASAPNNLSCTCNWLHTNGTGPDFCNHLPDFGVAMTVHSLAHLTPGDVLRLVRTSSDHVFFAATVMLPHPIGSLCAGEVQYKVLPNGRAIVTVGDETYDEPAHTWVNEMSIDLEFDVFNTGTERTNTHQTTLAWKIIHRIGDTVILEFRESLVAATKVPRKINPCSLTDNNYWGRTDFVTTNAGKSASFLNHVEEHEVFSYGSYLTFYRGEGLAYVPKSLVQALTLYVANRPRNKDTWDMLVSRARTQAASATVPTAYIADAIVPSCHIAFNMHMASEIDLMLSNLPFFGGKVVSLARPFIPDWMLHTYLSKFNLDTTIFPINAKYVAAGVFLIVVMLYRSRRDLVYHADKYLKQRISVSDDVASYYHTFSGTNWIVGSVPTRDRDTILSRSFSWVLKPAATLLGSFHKVDLVIRVIAEEIIKRIHPMVTPHLSILESLFASESFQAAVYRLASHAALAALPLPLAVVLHFAHNAGALRHFIQTANVLTEAAQLTAGLLKLWTPVAAVIDAFRVPDVASVATGADSMLRNFAAQLELSVGRMQLSAPWWAIVLIGLGAWFARRRTRVLTQQDCDLLASAHHSAPSMPVHTACTALSIPPVRSELVVPELDVHAKVQIIDNRPKLGRPARLAGWAVAECLPVNYASDTDGEYLAVTIRNLNPLGIIDHDAYVDHVFTMRLIFSRVRYTPMSFDEWNSHFPSATQRQLNLIAYHDSKTLLHPPGYSRVKAFSKNELLPHCIGNNFNMKSKRLIQGFYPAFNVLQGPPIYSFSKSVAATYNHTTQLCIANGTSAEQVGQWFEAALCDAFADDDWDDTLDLPTYDTNDPAIALRDKALRTIIGKHRGEGPIVPDFFNSRATILAGDFSNFDGTQGPALGFAECQVYADVGFPDHVVDTEIELWKHTSGVTAHGVKYSCTGRRKSGHPATSIGNSMLTASFFIRVFHKYDVHRWYLMVLGDDSLAVVHQDVSHVPWTDEATALGLQLKMAQPTPILAEFCSSRFWPTASGLLLAPKPFRVLSKTGWTLCDTNDLVGHIKGVIEGMRHSIDWMPILRSLVRLVDASRGVAHSHDSRKILATTHHEAIDETWVMFEMVYGVSRAEIIALEQRIERCQLPVVVSASYMVSCCAIDAGKDFPIRVTFHNGVAPVPFGDANDTFEQTQEKSQRPLVITIRFTLRALPTTTSLYPHPMPTHVSKKGRSGRQGRRAPNEAAPRVNRARARHNENTEVRQSVREMRVTLPAPRQPRQPRRVVSAELRSDSKEDPAALHALRAMLSPEIGAARLPDAYATGTAVFQTKTILSLPWVLDSLNPGKYYCGIYTTPLLKSKYATISSVAGGAFTWTYADDRNEPYALANFVKIRATGGTIRFANNAPNITAGGIGFFGNASNNGITGTSPPPTVTNLAADTRLSMVQLNDPTFTRDCQAVWIPSDETALQFHAVSDTLAPTDTDNFNQTALVFIAWIDYLGGSVAQSAITCNQVWNYEGLPYPTTVQPLDLRVAVGDESAMGRVLSHVRNVPTSIGNADTPATGTEGWVRAARKWLNRVAPAIRGAEAIYRVVSGGTWSGSVSETRDIYHFLGDYIAAIHDPDRNTETAEKLLAKYGTSRNVIEFMMPRLLAAGGDRRRLSDIAVRMGAQADHMAWPTEDDDCKSTVSSTSRTKTPKRG